MAGAPAIGTVAVKAYRIPTEAGESDGTLKWDATTLVVVQLSSGNRRGLGYTYADRAAAVLIAEKLAPLLRGMNPFDIPACRGAMVASLRNLGNSGIAMLAVSAVDNALWDLKAKLVDLPLVDLLGAFRESIPIYGSGGFTSLSIEELERQLGRWAEQGMSMVKMKIGRDPAADPERIGRAKRAVGCEAALFVDANGAYSRKQALAMTDTLSMLDVTWFEEPVPQYDREGLRMIRDRAPASMEISAGEYGFVIDDFRLLLESGAVDVLQADATRCGISGFLEAAALCSAFHIPLSSHCAPSLHIPLCCAAPPVRHLEYFHDHVRIEELLFDGVVKPVAGKLVPDRSRPGIGIELKEELAHRYEL